MLNLLRKYACQVAGDNGIVVLRGAVYAMIAVVLF